jgi:hypothetical protein
MNLAIWDIMDRGVPNRERIHLRVLADTVLSSYAVLNTLYVTPVGVATGRLLAFWFTSIPVKAGDAVILFTGEGQQTSQPSPDGKMTNHFFYWGNNVTLWNQDEACAVLLEVRDWETSRRLREPLPPVPPLSPGFQALMTRQIPPPFKKKE